MERAIRAVPKTTAFVVVKSTAHAIIVPADTAADSRHYDPEKMSAKDIVPIDPPLHEEMRACAVYDEDPVGDINLYAALCIEDALRLTGRFSKCGHRFVVCLIPETDNARQCVENLTATAVATTKQFEQLQAIQR